MDVVVTVCRRFSLSPFWLSPFRFVAVSVRLEWMSPLWFVAISVSRRFDCRRFDCRRFGSFKMDVAVMVCRRFDRTPSKHVNSSCSRRAPESSVSCRLPQVAEDNCDPPPRRDDRATSTTAYPGGAANRRQSSSLAVCHVSVSAKTSNDRSVMAALIQSVLFRNDCALSHPIVIDGDRSTVLLFWVIGTVVGISHCMLFQASWRRRAGHHSWNVNNVFRTARCAWGRSGDGKKTPLGRRVR